MVEGAIYNHLMNQLIKIKFCIFVYFQQSAFLKKIFQFDIFIGVYFYLKYDFYILFVSIYTDINF